MMKILDNIELLDSIHLKDPFMDLISNMIQYIYYGITDALSNRKQHIQPNYEVKYSVNPYLYFMTMTAGIAFGLWHVTIHILNIEGRLGVSFIIGALGALNYTCFQEYRQAKWSMQKYPSKQHFLKEYKVAKAMLMLTTQLTLAILFLLYNIEWFLFLPNDIRYMSFLFYGTSIVVRFFVNIVNKK